MVNADRGRPYRGVTPPTGGGRLSARHRTAWLLRVNRLYGASPEWATRAYAFAAAFRGGCWPDQADPSRISRWETAVTEVPYLAVRRYEELLALPPDHLSSAVDTLNRYLSPGAPLARPPRHLAALGHRVDDLLDAVTGHDTVTGTDWDELTAYLAARSSLRLRSSDWSAVAHRLLTETVVSDGRAWRQRFEAFNRLLGHPSGAPAAIAALADWAADPTNQAYIETVCLLDGSAHPDAARSVLAQLADPTNDDARYGALLACVRKLRHGHFRPDQVGQVAGYAAELLRETGARFHDTRVLAGSVLDLARARDPGGLPPSLRARAGGADATGPPPESVAPETRRHLAVLVARIAGSAVSLLPRQTGRFHDTTLPVLLEEALTDPVFDVRLHALLLLYATPYRAPLATAVGREITRLGFGRDTEATVRLFHALGILGGPAERRQAERVVLRGGVPAAVADAAARALAHTGGRSGDDFWTTALSLHGAAAHAGSDLSVRVLGDLVYALGIGGDRHWLRLLAADPRLPPALRSRARWWTHLPPYVPGPRRPVRPGDRPGPT
ncbi:XRE family transcriptional regulator [Streptomyces sp. NPDC006997]|uniref:XRE family transcriptional regulator n=1 Tax=Streptomyces sp. NPDC006997 TaxID=3155356 RepID=UPI00340550F2